MATSGLFLPNPLATPNKKDRALLGNVTLKQVVADRYLRSPGPHGHYLGLNWIGVESSVNGATLLLSLLTGSVGTGYFIYGKKQRKFLPMLSGAGLCVVLYFVSNLLLLAGLSLILCLLPFLISTD